MSVPDLKLLVDELEDGVMVEKVGGESRSLMLIFPGEVVLLVGAKGEVSEEGFLISPSKLRLRLWFV